jgi:hypothetical protein
MKNGTPETAKTLLERIRDAGIYTQQITKIGQDPQDGDIITCEVHDRLPGGYEVIGYWHPGEEAPRFC